MSNISNRVNVEAIADEKLVLLDILLFICRKVRNVVVGNRRT